MINSNLSNREAYAQYGKLDDARMEALFDAEDDLNADIETLEFNLKQEQDINENAKEQIKSLIEKIDILHVDSIEETLREILEALS